MILQNDLTLFESAKIRHVFNFTSGNPLLSVIIPHGSCYYFAAIATYLPVAIVAANFNIIPFARHLSRFGGLSSYMLKLSPTFF